MRPSLAFLLSTLFAVPGCNHDFSGKDPCFIALRETLRLPCRVLGPVERSEFLAALGTRDAEDAMAAQLMGIRP
jgi:hypothetical protein